MAARRRSTPQQLRRVADELAEAGFVLDGTEPWHDLAVAEIDYALRPQVHERRVPSFGAFVEPSVDPTAWEATAGLAIDRRPVGERSTGSARRYADGMSSWLIRRVDHHDEWAIFDRPADSERDLVVLAEAMGAVVVQRHPAGLVRVVGRFGVYRWDGIAWHHEPLVSTWIDVLAAGSRVGEQPVLETLLEFSVHDLGARGIGAILVYEPDERRDESFDRRLPPPPALQIMRPSDLAPLRHVLAHVDGAALFDRRGTLREIGVRLVPSREAETVVEGYRGMRHTSARRYSFDDQGATVIVVSDDGPVTVLKGGRILGASGTDPGAHQPPTAAVDGSR